MGKKMKQKRKQWSPKEMQLLMKYRAEGLNSVEIAKCMGRSQKAVQHKISEMRTPKPVPETVFPTEENSKPFRFKSTSLSKKYIIGAVVVAAIAAVVIERLL